LYVLRDVGKCVVQQKDCEGWRNDREVNTSANPSKEQGERQSEDYVYCKEIKGKTHTHKKKLRCMADQGQKNVINVEL